MTPLTVTRRNVVALDFTETTLVAGTGTGTPPCNRGMNSPYPMFAAHNNATSIGPAGPPHYPEDYLALWVNGATGQFGIKYDEERSPGSTTDGGEFALSRAIDSVCIWRSGLVETPTIGYYNDIAVDALVFETSDTPYIPVGGTITKGAAESFIGNGSASIQPVYTISGVNDQDGIMSRDTGDYFLNVRDGTRYKAFESETGFAQTPFQYLTLSTDAFNYTILMDPPDALSGNWFYMSKWTAEDEGDPFVYTNYAVSLSDATDDAVFQAAMDYDFDDNARWNANYENFWLTISTEWDGETPVTTATAFVFAKDFSWYDRIDITSDGALAYGDYWLDIDGNHYLVGLHNTAACAAYQFIQGEGGSVTDGSSAGQPIIRAWTFTLDGHDFYILHLGAEETLAYDRYTGEWHTWGTGNSALWRASTGHNWIAGRKFAENWSDVIVGDDTTGTLYFLSPDDETDDDAADGDDTPRPFTTIETGQIVVKPGYASVPCWGAQLFGSIGSSAATVNLQVSDDRGYTWVDMGDQTLGAADYNARANWLSLGSMIAPGRLFKTTSTGALRRIDGMEAD